MAKIALVNDTHFGVRSDSQLFSDFIGRFWSEVFFPYLDEHDIRYVRHLGDIVDRRKYINFLTARHLRDQFIDPCIERGIDLGVIIGNHDVFYKNTNEINVMQELFKDIVYENVKWWSKPVEEIIDGTKIVMMPWICPDNYAESCTLIERTNAQVLFGHLELAGFEMYRGTACDHGMDHRTFEKFDVVCSGHYHHKSTRGNINYLGAPYEMTWSDHDDDRGFHIFDTDDRSLTYVKNPLKMFHRIAYNDAVMNSLQEVLDSVDAASLKDCYVKIIVKEKNNPYWFSAFVDSIEKSSVADLRIVEDQLALDLEDGADIIDEAEDTLTMIKKFAATFLQDKDPALLKELNVLLQSLYDEAQQTTTTTI